MPATANAILVIALTGLMLPSRAPLPEPKAELSKGQEAAVVEVATDLVSRLAESSLKHGGYPEDICIQVFSLEPPPSVVTLTREKTKALVPDSQLRIWPGSKCHIESAAPRQVDLDTKAAIVAILDITSIDQDESTISVCFYFGGRGAIWWEYILKRKGDEWEVVDRKKRGIS
jgi:hypothetical protein